MHISLYYTHYNVYNSVMNSRDVIALIKKDGWVHIRTTGSHWHFTHPVKSGVVTIPHPKKDLPIGTLRSIVKQAQIILK